MSEIAAAACGDGWLGAGRRRAWSGASVLLGVRRSARKMCVLCGGCSAARSRSSRRRLCYLRWRRGVRGGELSEIVAAACGDGWLVAGRRALGSAHSAHGGARSAAAAAATTRPRSAFAPSALRLSYDGMGLAEDEFAADAAWRRLAGGRPTPHASASAIVCALGSAHGAHGGRARWLRLLQRLARARRARRQLHD